jgi:hypothetical protein
VSPRELAAYAAALAVPVVIGVWRSLQPPRPLQVGEDRRTVVIDAGSLQRFGQRTETTVGLVTGQRARTR